MRKSPKKDKVGQVFGRLTVISEAYNDAGIIYYNCICSCGTKIIKKSSSLKRKWNSRCDLCQGGDKTGARYGRLFVESKIPKLTSGSAHYNCLCDCGNKIIVKGDYLHKTGKKSCGCLKKELDEAMKRDISGKRIGRWIVIGRSDRARSTWVCKCDCGNIRHVQVSALNNNSKSCGCLARELSSERASGKYKDITGQKFNKLTAVKYLRKDGFLSLWLCQCDCGEYKETHLSSLQTGGTTRCSSCRSVEISGPNAYNWNHDITPEEREENKTRAYTPDYANWRTKVFQRDNRTCQISGIRGEVNAHHIESWISSKALRFEVSNGITILEPIHLLFHRLYGNGYNNRSQLDDFIRRYNNKEFDSILVNLAEASEEIAYKRREIRSSYHESSSVIISDCSASTS